MEKLRITNDEVKVLLPSDVWVEILLRVPAADLLPLKAVCKTFYRLISDDFFTRMHLNYFTKNPKSKSAILTVTEDYSYHRSSYYDPDERTISGMFAFNSPLHRFRRHWIIDSYDGLLLVNIFDQVFLCNPITRSGKFLPSIHNDVLRFGFCKIGYDDVSKQHKVFVLNSSESGNRVLFHVFDVHRDGEFRETTAVELGSQSTLVYVMESVLVNGNVYFLIITNIEESETLIGGTNIWRTRIVSANVTTEELKIRSCSDMPYLDKYSFFAANGTFYLTLNINYLSFDLWVLEGVESENPNPRWMIKQIIDLSDHITGMPQDYIIGYLVLGVFGTKVLIRMEIGEGREQLCQYDLISKEFEEVIVTSGCDNIAYGIIYYIFSRIVEHTNSLISL